MMAQNPLRGICEAGCIGLSEFCDQRLNESLQSPRSAYDLIRRKVSIFGPGVRADTVRLTLF